MFITFLQPARGHCQGLRPRRPISLETDSQQSSRWASPDSSLFHCPQVITCADVWDKTWRQSEGHSSSRLPDEHAYASPWAKDDSTRFKVITEAPRGQLTTNLRLVCSFWWAKSFNKTNSSKHRRTSRVADLNDSENVGSTASSQQRPTTHRLSLLHILVVLSCQCAMSVVSVEWTLWSPTWLVMWLDWNGALESVFLVSIPGTEWLVHRPCPKKHWCAFNTWQNTVIVYDFMGSFTLKKAFK